jgi:hypothetical protein
MLYSFEIALALLSQAKYKKDAEFNADLKNINLPQFQIHLKMLF